MKQKFNTLERVGQIKNEIAVFGDITLLLAFLPAAYGFRMPYLR